METYKDFFVRTCKCHEIPIVKKTESIHEGRIIQYPTSNEGFFKTFKIKYEKKLSPIAKILLNNFTNKYLYYAIDDILYLLKSNPKEQEDLLTILYSPVLSIHNNLSINFFDIWIHEIYINEVSKVNKFLSQNSKNFEEFNYITIKLLYKTRIPIKKQESLW